MNIKNIIKNSYLQSFAMIRSIDDAKIKVALAYLQSQNKI